MRPETASSEHYDRARWTVSGFRCIERKGTGGDPGDGYGSRGARDSAEGRCDPDLVSSLCESDGDLGPSHCGGRGHAAGQSDVLHLQLRSGEGDDPQRNLIR
ncbi:hypothetical protein JCM30394_08910 [Deferrisoma palaeochoriense]